MTKYILPQSRLPKAFNQNVVNEDGKVITQVGSCVACTFTKILEVINYVKTGKYVDLSKGYMYGRNNYPTKRQPGMMEEYTLNILLERGTVPLEMCRDYTELPDIRDILEAREDITKLDKEAEKLKLLRWENISGNNSKQLFENVKAYLQKYEMPLAGTIKKYEGEKHSVVIAGYDDAGYDDAYIYFHNHKGKDDLERVKYDKFSKAYYLDGGIDMLQIPFTDVKEDDWFYSAVEKVYDAGLMNGTSADKFSPNKPVTRAEFAAVMSRLLDKVGVK